MIEDIDPRVWFCEREVSYPPRHFVPTKSRLTDESKQWILDSLRGRFAITQSNNDTTLFEDFDTSYIGYASFEDPKEAMLFELRWS